MYDQSRRRSAAGGKINLLPPHAAVTLHVYFPDPWPKKTNQEVEITPPYYCEVGGCELTKYPRFFSVAVKSQSEDFTNSTWPSTNE